MGLKDDLIKRATSGESFAPKKEERKEPEIQDELEDLDLDLSDALDDELDSLDEELSEDSFGDLDLTSELDSMDDFNDCSEPEPIPEPEPAPEPARRRRKRKPKREPVCEYVEEPVGEEEYNSSYNQHVEDMFYEQPVQRPAQQKCTEQTTKTKSVGLESKLLDLAKSVVLNDVLSNFESEIVTTKALTKMVESYLENGSVSAITNGNAILSAVVDEVVASDYSESHYGEITKDILMSVKSDL